MHFKTLTAAYRFQRGLVLGIRAAGSSSNVVVKNHAGHFLKRQTPDGRVIDREVKSAKNS